MTRERAAGYAAVASVVLLFFIPVLGLALAAALIAQRVRSAAAHRAALKQAATTNHIRP
jgi:hypothetical protein